MGKIKKNTGGHKNTLKEVIICTLSLQETKIETVAPSKPCNCSNFILYYEEEEKNISSIIIFCSTFEFLGLIKYFFQTNDLAKIYAKL